MSKMQSSNSKKKKVHNVKNAVKEVTQKSERVAFEVIGINEVAKDAVMEVNATKMVSKIIECLILNATRDSSGSERTTRIALVMDTGILLPFSLIDGKWTAEEEIDLLKLEK